MVLGELWVVHDCVVGMYVCVGIILNDIDIVDYFYENFYMVQIICEGDVIGVDFVVVINELVFF